jgi:signal transduction histidine kinase
MRKRLQHVSGVGAANETQRRGAMFLRALPIFLIPLFATFAAGMVILFLSGGNVPPDATRDRNPWIPLVVGAVFLIALVVLVRLGKPNWSGVLLIGVWTLLTTLFGIMNGVSSLWAALLIVPICAAGLLIDGFASITLAALASLLIVALGILEWYGVLSPEGGMPRAFVSYLPIISIAFWVGIFWTIAALTYLLASNMQSALKASRAQAAQLRELSDSLEARVEKQTSELLAQSREAAVMEERARVARDIHDTLAQGLTGIVVQLGAAERALHVAPNDAREHITLAQDMAREALAEARRSIWNLRAGNLERGELRDALAGLAARASNEKMRVTFDMRGDVWALHADVESALLRVAQEALVNANKHANATQADVLLEYQPDAIRLLIHDNGIGLDDDALKDAERLKNPHSGFGLMGMRERIAQWGGTLKLTNDDGAKVEATIPRLRAERSEKPFEVSETAKVLT